MSDQNNAVPAETRKPRNYTTVENLALTVRFVNVRKLKDGTLVPVLQLVDDVETAYEMWLHGIGPEAVERAGIARGARWVQDLSVAETPDVYTSPKTGVKSETFPCRPASEVRDFVPAVTIRRAFPMLA